MNKNNYIQRRLLVVYVVKNLKNIIKCVRIRDHYSHTGKDRGVTHLKHKK